MRLPEETLDFIDPKSLIGKRLVVVIGPTDVGKSSFIKRVYNELCRKIRVFVLDADVGQSDIGPPCTIALGTGERPVDSLSQLDIVSLHFYGFLTPASDTGDFLWGVGRMLARARSYRPDLILVNTTGWVDGYRAFSLKASKVSLLGPDLVVVVGVTMGEYFRFFSSSSFTTVWVRQSHMASPKSMEERRRARLEKVMGFFGDMRELYVRLHDVTIFGDTSSLNPRQDTGEDFYIALLRDLEWRVVGFLGPDIRTVGVGWVQRVDVGRGRMVVKSFFPDNISYRYVKFGPKFIPCVA